MTDRAAGFWTRTALTAGALMVLAGGLHMLARGPDGALARSYGRALANAETSWLPPAENVWLSRLGDQPAALRRTLALGDRISIGGNGLSDEIDVVGLEQIDGESFGLAGLRIQVVTGRRKGAAGPGETEPRFQHETVRFLFAVDGLMAAPTPAPTQPGRAL